MEDIQNQQDTRNIAINKVGIKELRYPIVVLDRQKNTQQTVADINMYVNLPKEFRGTHMSRFIEVLKEHHNFIHIDRIDSILKDVNNVLSATSSHIELFFPYFIKKRAPVSKISSLMAYECKFTGILDENFDLIMAVKVPILTLCPCSKEISEYNAHNQRGIASIEVRYKDFVWIEELIEIAENAASSGVYALLKRQDEKYVTEKAYEKPAFVEDVVREIAQKLLDDDRITWLKIEIENFESIHNHNAYAVIERKK